MGSLEKRVAEATGGAERGEEEPERAESPTPLRGRPRRAHGGVGDAGDSESEGRRSDCRDLWCPLTDSSQASAWSSMMKNT